MYPKMTTSRMSPLDKALSSIKTRIADGHEVSDSEFDSD